MIALYVLSFVFISSPFLPATGHPHWFFRTADFVRLQSIAIELLLVICWLFFGNTGNTLHFIIALLLVAAIAYQFHKVYPYSSLYPRSKQQAESEGTVSILAMNVFQDNQAYDKVLACVQEHDPDLVLTMESNKDWEQGLSPLEKDYPFTVKLGYDNYYGMHLYSKVELHNVTHQDQIEEKVPSIFFEYPLLPTQSVFFACLHPAPPSPTENETSKERDAELMLTGKHIRNLDLPAVVCGDMNDVVWSRISRLFKKMTGMIDPRIGRGFFATYHAKYWFMRFPLDHLFHTKDLFVEKMERTKNIGSDHFGMYYEIHLKKKVATATNPILNVEEKQEVEEFIDSAQES